MLPAVSVQAQEDEASQWVDLSNIARESGVGGGQRAMAVDPVSGKIHLLTKTGLWISTDQGQSWEQIKQAPIAGNLWYSDALSYDRDTGGIGAFMKDPPEDPCQSAFRPRPEAGWQKITRVLEGDRKSHQFGWSWGIVHWQGDPVELMLARMHHSSRIWMSEDAGESWVELQPSSNFFGITPGGALLVYDDKAKTLSRSGDRAKSWEVVLEDIEITEFRPVIFHGRTYWLVKDGWIASDDDGQSWQKSTFNFTDAYWGPYFGRDTREIMVVTLEDVLISRDAGESWQVVADNRRRTLEDNFGGEKFQFDWFIGQTAWGWDPARGLIYVAHGKLERLSLPDS